MTTPARRWSFSLRTLFVVVTVAAAPMAWIGWNYHIVSERQSAREWLRGQHGDVYPTFCLFTTIPERPQSVRVRNEKLDPTWVRRMLVDEPAGMIELPKSLSQPERARM